MSNDETLYWAPDLRMIIRDAEFEADALRHDYVGTEHLLLGLLRYGKGVGFHLLANYGISPSALRVAIFSKVRPGRGKGKHPLTLTPRARKVLSVAELEARAQGRSFVDSAFLLLGLVHEERGIAAEALGEQGFGKEAAVEAIHLSRLGAASPPKFPPVEDLPRAAGAERPVLAVVADLDEVPATVVADFMGALDALHRAWGGAGLRLEGGTVGSTSSAGTYA
jgi:ATP-dependent Clp protease ATP-binding subunit ClpA